MKKRIEELELVLRDLKKSKQSLDYLQVNTAILVAQINVVEKVLERDKN